MADTLTYLMQKLHRTRWMTWIFCTGSAVLIITLLVINYALVGYESVTLMIADPNITHYYQWWAPNTTPHWLKIRTKPEDCQATKLPLNMPLRTNSSLPLFSYTLANTFHRQKLLRSSQDYHVETPYKANPLNACQVQNLSIKIEPKILAFNIATSVFCDPTGEPPRALQFQTTFDRAQDISFRPDSILEFMAYRAQPNHTKLYSYGILSQYGPPNDTFLNVLGVVDALGSDLMYAIWMQKAIWMADKVDVPELGYMSWDSQLDARTPTDDSRLTWQTYSDGYWYSGEFMENIKFSVVNMFVAIRDAIMIDIGNIVPTNIYLNKTAFDSMVVPDPFVSVNLVPNMTIYYPNDTKHGACSWTWGCSPSFDVSWAQALTSTDYSKHNITLPINASFPYSTVIDMIYLCPRYQIKTLYSRWISIIISTFTIYTTIYEISALAAPWVYQRLTRPTTRKRNPIPHLRGREIQRLIEHNPSN